MALALTRVSEYLSGLSATAKQRYIAKVSKAGLSVDPYTIIDWKNEPETIPQMNWSDFMLYMIATPSEYTKSEIKV